MYEKKLLECEILAHIYILMDFESLLLTKVTDIHFIINKK